MKIYDPDQDTDNDDCPECLVFIVLDVSEKRLEGIPKEIAAGAHRNSPNQRPHGIEQDEFYSRNRAHANDKGGNGSQPIQESEHKD